MAGLREQAWTWTWSSERDSFEFVNMKNACSPFFYLACELAVFLRRRVDCPVARNAARSEDPHEACSLGFFGRLFEGGQFFRRLDEQHAGVAERVHFERLVG